MEEWIVVKVFNTHIEADIAKGFLQSHNIPSIIRADDEGGAYPYPIQPTITGVKLFVQKKDLDKAKKLLKNK